MEHTIPKKEKITAIRVRKETTDSLKAIARSRGRRESMEQVILELISVYSKEK